MFQPKAMALSGIAALGLFAGAANATVTFTGSGAGFGSATLKAAQADFDISGSNLVVTLTNTTTDDTLVPADLLTAIFFDIAGAPDLSVVSAVLNAGSSVYYDADGQPAGGVVGGEWAYRDAMAGAPGSRSYGISSTGVGLFGPGDRFPGPDLQSPTSPDGPQYGILSAGDDSATGNGGITGSGGLIKNSVVFTLSGLPQGFNLNSISNVLFFYGTAIGEGDFPGNNVPTPGALALASIGLLAGARRRR